MSEQPQSPTSTGPERGSGAGGRTTALLIALCLAQFMLVLDVVVVSVALPSIQDDLEIAPADLQWISTAYGIAFGAFLIVSGRTADLLGARRVFLVGLVAFMGASLACGLAQGSAQVLLARGAQGLAAAVVSPAALALLTVNFREGEERNRALGVWAAVASGGAVAGQLLGGVITDLLDWRWIFLINLPLGTVVVAMAARLLAPDHPGARGDRAPLDLRGATLLAGGLVLIVFAISRAAEGGVSAADAAMGLAGVLTLLAFIFAEQRLVRIGGEPLVRFGFFTNPNVRWGNIAALASAAAVATVIFLTTLYLQRVLGLSPLEVGLGFAPVTLAIVVISTVIAKVIARVGLRRTLGAGALLTGVGVVLLAFVPANGSYLAHVLPGLMLVGVGSGLSYAPSMIAATSAIRDSEHGLASGIVNTSLQLGGALGVAVLVSIAVATTGDAATGASGPAAEALTDGYRTGFGWAAALPPLMAVAALALPRQESPNASRDQGSVPSTPDDETDALKSTPDHATP